MALEHGSISLVSEHCTFGATTGHHLFCEETCVWWGPGGGEETSFVKKSIKNVSLDIEDLCPKIIMILVCIFLQHALILDSKFHIPIIQI